MLLRTGIDLVAVSALSAHVAADPSFLDMVWTKDEQADCAGEPYRLATRWAAKEAAMKALGAGWPDVDWTDIAVTAGSAGPSLSLGGNAAALANELGLTQWEVSMSHESITEDTLAVAVVIGTGVRAASVGAVRGIQ